MRSWTEYSAMGAEAAHGSCCGRWGTCTARRSRTLAASTAFARQVRLSHTKGRVVLLDASALRSRILLRAANVGILTALTAMSLVGCRKPVGGDAPMEAKEHVWKLFRLYKVYVERNKKGPPDEQSLRDLGNKLTPEERKSYIIGDDIE